MPWRNRVPNAAELVSRSLNCTRADSPCDRSDMVNALTPMPPASTKRRLMMNKSLRGRGRESSRNPFYGFRQGADAGQKPSPKKDPPLPAALKLITGRRQTEWTGATRCPNEDDRSHKRESLMRRKRTIYFRFHLPYRPLAEVSAFRK